MRNWKNAKRLVLIVTAGTILSLGGVLAPFKTAPVSAASPKASYQVQRSGQAIADKIIRLGLKYWGTPYVFGARLGQTRSFDCSSFTKYVYGRYGISLPRLANAQKQTGQIVPYRQMKKGDLMFFHTGYRSVSNNRYRADHVAIYIGNGKILHTTPGLGVHVSKLDGYWKKTFIVAKRVI